MAVQCRLIGKTRRSAVRVALRPINVRVPLPNRNLLEIYGGPFASGAAR